MFVRIGFWKDKNHYLDKMELKQLIPAYFQYYAVQAYLALAAIALYVAFTNMTSLWTIPITSGIVIFVAYPPVSYLLHRYVLHGNIFYKNPFTARAWKRVHYDHHQDPNHLSILFGALYTTLPVIFGMSLPVGWLVDGLGGAAFALATGLLLYSAHEFCHCVMHLNIKPKNRYLKTIKKLHVMHHFQNEQINYGIMNFWFDKILGTYEENSANVDKSPTVFDLGYTAEMAEKYPWVARMPGGVSHDSVRERRKKPDDN